MESASDDERAAGNAPYGLQRTAGKRLIVNAEERRVLDTMIARRRAGAACAAIADELNAQGSRTRTGREWTRQTVHQRLIVAGVFECSAQVKRGRAYELARSTWRGPT